MKTVKQLMEEKPVYLHNWKDKVDVVGDFEDIYLSGEDYRAETAPYANVAYWQEKKQRMDVALKGYEDVNILFASYGTDDYQGDAFVLFEQGGKLYEVNGSHCSCMGLEGQWSPEETSVAALAHRLTEGRLGTDHYSDNVFAAELREFLGLPE